MSLATPKFCISILPKTVEQLTEWVSDLDTADMVEIRLDYLSSVNIKVVKDLVNIPIIITIRCIDEGGFFTGTTAELMSTYQQAIDAGVDFIDIDYNYVTNHLSKLKLNQKIKLILSCHSLENDVGKLEEILFRMTKTRAEVYKLVYSASNLNDNLTTITLIDYVKGMNIPFVIHAQGNEGNLSRILGSVMGNIWTYVSFDDQSQSAPGQLSIQQLRDQYYLYEKNQNCCLIGLVGFPVSQSKGWLIFNRLFHLQKSKKSSDDSRTNTLYLNFPVKDLSEFWNKWNDKLSGLSITIPHKESILQFADSKSTEVKLTGVSNTLIKRDRQWNAYNTDCLAIIELLKPFQKQLLKKGVLVYGTGATTRSVIAALQSLNVQVIFVMGRNKERGRLLEKLFSITFLEDDYNILDLSAIIQTTPVGMYPNIDEIPDCAKLLKKGMIAFDVIFNPLVTQFLKFAKDCGCITILGEEMYFHQAKRQFELFTGSKISINYLKKVWRDLFSKT